VKIWLQRLLCSNGFNLCRYVAVPGVGLGDDVPVHSLLVLPSNKDVLGIALTSPTPVKVYFVGAVS
jgi:hypothetical protein